MKIRIHAIDTIPGAQSKRPDPYLVWAQLTGWIDLIHLDAGTSPAHAVPLLVELESGASIGDFREKIMKKDPAAKVPTVYQEGRFVAIWLHAEHLEALATDGDLQVSRFDLCLPNSMQGGSVIEGGGGDPPGASVKVDTRILIGVIDSGCPFGRSSLVRWDAGGAPSTRIAAIWDMRHGKPRCPAAMGYGSELRRGSELDPALKRCQDGPASIDEFSLYLEHAQLSRRAGELRRRVSHGAHVLDVLAGPLPQASRIYANPDKPPTWAPAVDAATDPKRSDIVFVQLPNHALQDNTGGWLGSHVLDAMHYIVSLAGESTRDVVINLSYGGTVGPHNGTAMLEQAIDELVSRRKQEAPHVHVVVAAGNAWGTRGHAVLGAQHFAGDGGKPAASVPLVWRIAPNALAPNFMELWFPDAWAEFTPRLRIQPPGAQAFELALGQVATWPAKGPVQATIVFLQRVSRGDGKAMALLAVAPTETADPRRAAAPHGDWMVQVLLDRKPGAGEGELHAYIARNDRDIGTLRRGRPSYFVDPLDEPSRYLRGAADDPGMFDSAEIDPPAARAGSVIRRRGTLSAVSTGEHTRVATGYQLRSGDHASYASAGPSRGAQPRQPTASLVTDLSAVLPGVRAAGNSGASSFRMVGTSTAAPQLARKLIDRFGQIGVPPTPTPIPKPFPSRKAPCDVFGVGPKCDGRLPVDREPDNA